MRNSISQFRKRTRFVIAASVLLTSGAALAQLPDVSWTFGNVDILSYRLDAFAPSGIGFPPIGSEDPTLPVELGRRYEVTVTNYLTHPFAVIAKGGSAAQDRVLLSMAIAGPFESDPDVAWEDNGQGTVRFTLTMSLYEAMIADGHRPGYRCEVHSTTMRGDFTVSQPPTNGGPKPEPPPAGEPVPLAPGLCVVLLGRTIALPEVRPGQSGMILCCDAEDCSGTILVHWFFFTDGIDDTRNCAGGTPLSLPLRSATWINPREVPLGVCFNECGTLREGERGCVVFAADDNRTYNLVDADMLSSPVGPMGEFDFGDRVRVQGLVQMTGPRTDLASLCPEQDADIHGAVLSLCAPSGGGGCCNGRFQPGDRVVLLVDNPRGPDGKAPVGLRAGTRGTVVCCGSDDAALLIFVSWDGFTGGTNAGAFCDIPAGDYPGNSGWWAGCDQIALLPGAPGPCPNDMLILEPVGFGTWRVLLRRDSQCPATARMFSTCTTVAVSPGSVTASGKVVPSGGVNGTWDVNITVLSESNADARSFEVCVSVDDIDLTKIPAARTTEVGQLVVDFQTPY